jgi:uncharacterized protein (DUF58 family)
MPTIRGWAALGAGLALLLLWIGFGEELLLGVAVFLLLAVLFGALYVRRIAPRVGIERRISPTQVHDGDRAIVEITLVAGRRIHAAFVEDVVQGLGAARFSTDRVEPHTPMVARYEVLCRPRGVYRVGPAEIKVTDPLAMAESGGTTGRVDRLVVYPTVEKLEGLPIVRGQDPNVNTSRANFSQTGGEDFFTLREYQQGDDLRRVHWPSSARRDELMIRQLEMPWQSRALIVLDPRLESYATPESFEHAVRGAASVMRHFYGRGFSPTLWTGLTEGNTIGSAAAYAVAMEELATVRTTTGVDLSSFATRMRRSGLSGGALVLVTGSPDESEVAVYRVLGRDYAKTVLMAVAQKPNEAILQFQRGGAVTVLSGSASTWSAPWREAMEKTWSTASVG